MWYVRLGSRIWGPISEEQLQTLHRRGEFTKIHQVSRDQAKWQSASDLITSWKTPAKPVQEVQVPEKSDASWYYCLPNKQQNGPITQEVLLTKARSGEITAKHYIFGKGYSKWIPAHHVDFLGFEVPARKNSALGLFLFGALAVSVCIATGIGTYFAIRYFHESTDDSFNVPGPPVSTRQESSSPQQLVAPAKTNEKLEQLSSPKESAPASTIQPSETTTTPTNSSSFDDEPTQDAASPSILNQS